jgi:alpha-L-fucosidase
MLTKGNGLIGRRDVTRLLLMASAIRTPGSFASSLGGGPEDENARTAWYRQAKFGMFIHWGPYSLASVEASWPIMRPSDRFRITEAEYHALPERFNPARFDPYAWVDLAKSTGQRYMVFTTKHHDGFCMFDSSYTNYKITNTPYRRDIVSQLAQACKREGMPLGFYYSPPDMNHPGFRDTSKLASTNWNGEPTREQWPVYLEYMQMQLRELLQNCGDVVLIWFDGLYHQEKYDGRHVVQSIHEVQPLTLVNNRIGIPGDFETPEQFLPDSIPVKGRTLDFDHHDAGSTPGEVPRAEDFRLWETCMTINTTWAYNKNDRDFKSAQHLIRTLVEVASRGGNFLLNVGPGPDGTIQPEFDERLRAIGRWLEVNGASIYGTTYGPIQNVPFARTTSKGRYVFLHVFEMPSEQIRLPGLKGQVESITLLGSDRPATFQQTDNGVTITTSGLTVDPNVTVFKFTMK